ncbi:benzaldehyde dehydrogenase [Paraburkholderia caribensis]|uniref:Benzaldehyde dehydrogenase n=1 Tax=Paraburkholderia caribensis TaxID=75105 RepID=A0A9Q6S9C5_9BURK|nr:benzaldehyde dehydrogenase [Paraburkholderia caribensis]PTB27567.1 benzaldehyde dehydrogenase [Paraburkholderia caribensis]QLB67377.1 benzaldehyde dehydrogenase [Paraburkholderia caribensis]
MDGHTVRLLDAAQWQGKFFNGDWVDGASSQSIVEPATGEPLTTIGWASPAQAAESARSAHSAQRKWTSMPYLHRADVFRRAAALLEANRGEVIDWIVRETGAIAPFAEFQIQGASVVLHEAAAMLTQSHGVMLPSDGERLSFARRLPHGVVGIISPFNVPLILSIRGAAPALATGNAVLLKPDPQTAITGGFLIARLFELAGLPRGCLHVLPGGADVGEAVVTDRHVSMISFTGSTGAGRRVGELASRHLKKVTLELGGKNRLIVLDDADLDLAASCAAWGGYLHQGQICMATGIVLVHEHVAEAFTQKLVQKAKNLRVGNPAGRDVQLGPIINERQRDRVHQIVESSLSQGCELLAGGRFDRLFYEPTVLANVRPGTSAFDDEVFGPVLSVVTFRDDDEAVELGNNSEYGLSLGIVSRSVTRALSIGNRIPTGLLHINDQTVGDEGHIPFGGRGASGNGGRHGGHANWDEFTQWQWVTVQDVPPCYPF